MDYELKNRAEAVKVIEKLEAKIKKLESEKAELAKEARELRAKLALKEAKQEVKTQDNEAARKAEIEAIVLQTLGVAK